LNIIGEKNINRKKKEESFDMYKSIALAKEEEKKAEAEQIKLGKSISQTTMNNNKKEIRRSSFFSTEVRF
jgi:hypothetical protein